jgi:hypothetical protein
MQSGTRMALNAKSAISYIHKLANPKNPTHPYKQTDHTKNQTKKPELKHHPIIRQNASQKQV